ncbi:MAG TPA: DUF1080 domain-containing protein [Opitutaceae bacterium]|jgi:hypothetical protein
MKTHACLLGALLGLAVLAPCARADQAPNTLTPQEVRDGWKLLWDGRTTDGWRSARHPYFPKSGWVIHDGVLHVIETGGKEGGPGGDTGGDIITTRKYSNFDLKADFKITPGCNSGIKIFVDPELNKGAGSSIGLEYQILDDLRHPDAKLGRDGDRTLGALYDLYPPIKDKPVNPMGEWNHAEIISNGPHVEHWLNGVRILQYDRFTPGFRQRVQESKFKRWPGFGELHSGYILLQDHGDEVFFRNIKIKVLPDKT